MCLTEFVVKNIDFLSQLFEEGSLKSWNDLKIEYNLMIECYFQWPQLKQAISHKWKTIIKQNPGNASDLLIHKNVIQRIYSILITKFTIKSSSNVFFSFFFFFLRKPFLI